MATIPVNIPDGQVNRVANAFAVAYGHQDTIPDPAVPGATLPNPETKQGHLRRQIMEFIRNTVQSVEANAAAETARAAEIAKPGVAVS